MPTNKSLVSRLRSVSLDASGGEAGKGDNHLSSHSRPVPTISQYHQNYQPMAKGLRHSVWEEGYKQRCERKQNGFNHFKLEWIVPTDRRYLINMKASLICTWPASVVAFVPPLRRMSKIQRPRHLVSCPAVYGGANVCAAARKKLL
jgi:hypothetical protein